MLKQLRPALVIFFLMSILTGVLYPAAITALAQAIFPFQANGSLIVNNGKTLGSQLIGQQFDDPKYFWGRLSSTSTVPYNTFNPQALTASSGSNYGPLNPALMTAVKARIAALKNADPANTAPIPIDLVTSSGSGLDPHISVAAANYQAARVARSRSLEEGVVQALVAKYTQERQFYILGEQRVNVLLLNLALDGLQ